MYIGETCNDNISEKRMQTLAFRRKLISSESVTVTSLVVSTIEQSEMNKTQRCIFQNLSLIWLDSNINESIDGYHNSITQLRSHFPYI